jgi:photosystem II stability/assembly factor-like uncharacterized protein
MSIELWSSFSSQSYGNIGYYDITMSYSGQYQIAASSNDNNIFISSDYGNTWSSKEVDQSNGDLQYGWWGVSISGSGQYQLIIDGSQKYLYLSSNYGNTWSKITNIPLGINSIYGCAAISESGQYQLVSLFNGNTYSSNNYGNTWNVTSINYTLVNSVAISSTGQYQIAVIHQSSGKIFRSTDYGVTWNAVSNTTYNYVSVAVSNTGQYQSALLSDSNIILISNNYGSTWVSKTFNNTVISGTNGNAHNIIISGTGQYQVISACNDYIHYSTDYGNNWTTINELGQQIWYGAAISSDGKYISLITLDNSLYILSQIDNTQGNDNTPPQIVVTPQIDFRQMLKPFYTNNSLVYYKPGSLSACGVGSVRNSSVKSKKI